MVFESFKSKQHQQVTVSSHPGKKKKTLSSLLNKQQGESPKKSSPERGFKPWPKKCFRSALIIYAHVIINVIISLLVSSFKHWRVPIFFLSGDFFLAELIESQDETNKCVVADVSWNWVVTKLNKPHKSWNEFYTRKAFFFFARVATIIVVITAAICSPFLAVTVVYCLFGCTTGKTGFQNTVKDFFFFYRWIFSNSRPLIFSR